jgi:hypothetical protein
MKFWLWSTAFVVVTALAAATPSRAAPPQLLGKHILLRGTVTTVGQPIAGGQPVTGKISQERIIYISSAGRIFARMNATNGDVSAVREQSPGNSPFDDTTYRWEGNALVGTSTAVRSTISFDASFRSCAVSVVLRPHATAWDFNHKQWRILSTNSDATCTIQDGNPFAGQ